MFAACHLTLLDHGGGSAEEVTEDHVGSPDRLFGVFSVGSYEEDHEACLIEVTSQSRAAAALHIRLPVVVLEVASIGNVPL